MEKYVFDTYYRNKKTAHVEMDRERKLVKYERYSNQIPHVPFLFDKPSYGQMVSFLEQRCMPKKRKCMPEYLSTLGIQEYDPYKIVEITHGVMFEDYLWIKFPDETTTWEEVKVRD